MSEEYDSFDYVRPADYLPALKENYQQQNEGFERAEQMARVNDQQRLANAKIAGNTIDSVMKFSKTMAEAHKKHAEERDLKFRNTATQIQLESGASLAGWTKYQEDNGKLATETGYYNELAQQFKDTNVDLYNKLTSLTGWQAVSFKRNMLRRAGIDYKENFKANINQQDDAGNYIHSFTTADGRNINWSTAKDTAERDLVIAEYNKNVGLSDVSWANPEFLKDNFQPIYEKQLHTIRTEWSEKRKAEDDRIRLAGYEEDLILAAHPDNGRLGEEVKRLLTTEYGHYSDPQKAREAVAAKLVELTQRTGEDGRPLIPSYMLASVSETLMDTPHRGTKKIEKLGYFKEFSEDALVGAVVELQYKQAEIKNKQIKIKQAEFVFEVQKQLAALERPPTEAEAFEIQQLWANDPSNAGIQMPEFIKTLTTRTLEDRSDDELIAYYTLQLYDGNQVPDSVINQIQDGAKREAFRKEVQASGLSSDNVSYKNSIIQETILEKLEETLATDQDKGSIDFQIRQRNAKASFNTIYNNLKGKVKEEERFDRALEQVVNNINRGGYSKSPKFGKDVTEFATNLATVKKNILEQKNNGVDLNQYFSTTLLPGSDKHYAKLEKYVKDPLNNQIPFFYKELARDMKISKNGTPMTGWHIANMQYKSQTGKELPKPSSILKLESQSPIVMHLYTWKSSKWNTMQATHIRSGGTFNEPESLTSGLIQ